MENTEKSWSIPSVTPYVYNVPQLFSDRDGWFCSTAWRQMLECRCSCEILQGYAQEGASKLGD
jgi:hypothetical protein